MRILIGYERSGVVRTAFRALGHDARSCDLFPADDGSPHHIQGDVWSVVNEGWDIGIFFPDCTYLTVSAAWAFGDGPYHQRVKPDTLVGAARRHAREKALDEIRRLLDLPYPKAVENPARSFISQRIRPPDQIIHPNQFGEDASKITGLWLDRLSPLMPTKRVRGRVVEWPRGSGRMFERWANQTDSGQNRLTPGDGRAAERARTYPGIAEAMADQWGKSAPSLLDIMEGTADA